MRVATEGRSPRLPSHSSRNLCIGSSNDPSNGISLDKRTLCSYGTQRLLRVRQAAQRMRATLVPLGGTVTSTPMISADGHVIEPPDLWTSRVPHEFRELAPHVE